ncbi:MAG: hypothetical protein IH823_07325 [Candidatus Dadabacteria bacterium]|nr:hypothetical protein [Candidatus Dadabacteria bacterium]
MAENDEITQTGIRLPETLLMGLKIVAIKHKTSANAILLAMTKKFLADYKENKTIVQVDASGSVSLGDG